MRCYGFTHALSREAAINVQLIAFHCEWNRTTRPFDRLFDELLWDSCGIWVTGSHAGVIQQGLKRHALAGACWPREVSNKTITAGFARHKYRGAQPPETDNEMFQLVDDLAEINQEMIEVKEDDVAHRRVAPESMAKIWQLKESYKKQLLPAFQEKPREAWRRRERWRKPAARASARAAALGSASADPCPLAVRGLARDHSRRARRATARMRSLSVLVLALVLVFLLVVLALVCLCVVICVCHFVVLFVVLLRCLFVLRSFACVLLRLLCVA